LGGGQGSASDVHGVKFQTEEKRRSQKAGVIVLGELKDANKSPEYVTWKGNIGGGNEGVTREKGAIVPVARQQKRTKVLRSLSVVNSPFLGSGERDGRN